MSRVIKGTELQELITASTKPPKVRGRVYTHNWFTGKGEVTGWEYREGFHTVTAPLHVFKKIYCYTPNIQVCAAIANLVIPVGAEIFIGNYAYERWAQSGEMKMRASEAFVHSVVRIGNLEQVSEGHAGYDNNFKYVPGTTVKPTKRFSKSEDQCSTGIHFFINLTHAKNW
jgi:hypothetical protein